MYLTILQFILFRFWIGPLIKTLFFDGPYEVIDGTLEYIQTRLKKVNDGLKEKNHQSTDQ